jgi:diguanylate cyclase (GGDEF)-like protein/PAS domain S-box-containing protein
VAGVDDFSFEELYRDAPCGLVSTSPVGTIIQLNDTLLALIGYTREQLLGQPFTDLLDSGGQLFSETRQKPILHLNGEVREVSIGLRRSDGSVLPVLINSLTLFDSDGSPRVTRTAIFDATARQDYEHDLLLARRSAQSSEARVRVLQDISSAFGLSTSDEDVARSFVEISRDAFFATKSAVMLLDDRGDLQLVAGANPLFGKVPAMPELHEVMDVVVVTRTDAERRQPRLAEAMHEHGVESLSITPLLDEPRRIGLLLCFFERENTADEQFYELQKALGRQASQALIRVRLERQLAMLALRDQLTGLANRQLLQEKLSLAIASAASSNTPLAVVFLDLDGFKGVNDALGHLAGDDVLREVSRRLREVVRHEDTVGRLGGDEFVAICENADLEAAASIADRIRVAVREPIGGIPDTLRVSASVGVAMYLPEHDAVPTNDQLLDLADAAMYHGKAAGKDRVTFVER